MIMFMEMKQYLIEIALSERQPNKLCFFIDATDCETAENYANALVQIMPPVKVNSTKQECEVEAKWYVDNVTESRQ